MRRNVLVIAQVAVCTLVLVGMGLCERSLYNLRHVDPGFSARNLIAMTVFPRKMPEAKGRSSSEDVRRKVSELPGVEAETLAPELPLLGASPDPVQFPEAATRHRSRTPWWMPIISTLPHPGVRGRVFDSRDRESAPEVMVVNHKMADQFWPGRGSGGTIRDRWRARRKAMVVGMVADGKYEDLDEAPRPFFYYALSQHYQIAVNIIARTNGDPRWWLEPLAQ